MVLAAHSLGSPTGYIFTGASLPDGYRSRFPSSSVGLLYSKRTKNFGARATHQENVASPPPLDPVQQQGPPVIEVEFVGPESGSIVTKQGNSISVISGEKVLRNVMLENKLELYGLYGKVMNCGGGGSCGTCIVEILEGEDLLNEKTDTEFRYLKKKPEAWRLACRTIVGNKMNSGKVVVRRLPQKR